MRRQLFLTVLLLFTVIFASGISKADEPFPQLSSEEESAIYGAYLLMNTPPLGPLTCGQIANRFLSSRGYGTLGNPAPGVYRSSFTDTELGNSSRPDFSVERREDKILGGISTDGYLIIEDVDGEDRRIYHFVPEDDKNNCPLNKIRLIKGLVEMGELTFDQCLSIAVNYLKSQTEGEEELQKYGPACIEALSYFKQMSILSNKIRGQ